MIKKNRVHAWTRMVMILMVALVITACGGNEPADETVLPDEPVEAMETGEAEETESLPVFTLEELAEYDGKEGRPAYVAVDGQVYDFSSLGRWSGGMHNGYEAGQDLTEALHNASPHGAAMLNRATVVGILAP